MSTIYGEGYVADWFKPSPPIEATEVAFTMAEEKLCEDVDTFADFIAGSIDVAQPSRYWSYISNHDLTRILLNVKATDEQLAQAAKELRRRYIADREDLIQQYAKGAME